MEIKNFWETNICYDIHQFHFFFFYKLFRRIVKRILQMKLDNNYYFFNLNFLLFIFLPLNYESSIILSHEIFLSKIYFDVK